MSGSLPAAGEHRQDRDRAGSRDGVASAGLVVVASSRMVDIIEI